MEDITANADRNNTERECMNHIDIQFHEDYVLCMLYTVANTALSGAERGCPNQSDIYFRGVGWWCEMCGEVGMQGVCAGDGKGCDGMVVCSTSSFAVTDYSIPTRQPELCWFYFGLIGFSCRHVVMLSNLLISTECRLSLLAHWNAWLTDNRPPR